MASSRPAPAPATAPAGVGAEETGRLGFVFIPRVVDRQSHHHMFWPALIFSSPGALRRRLPSPRDMEMFDLELENHQMNQRGALRESKALHPMDGTMKVAFLLGNEIPPSVSLAIRVILFAHNAYLFGTSSSDVLSGPCPTAACSKGNSKLRCLLSRCEKYSKW